MENTIRQAYLLVTTTGEEAAMPIHAFDGKDGGQVQIGSQNREWVLHLAGTPASWRHLAKVIEDAAMELEGQLATPAERRTA